MTEAFEKAGVEYETIAPKLDVSKIDSVGLVMSAAGHCQWCLEQMAIFMSRLRSGEVKSGDCCYFDDLWFPGLEAIPYTAELMNLNIGVYGFIHAGSFTKFDFTNPMSWWARFVEKGWFKFSDLIFVGSQQTKDDMFRVKLIDNNEYIYGDESDKVKVTGLPFEVDKEKVSQYLPNVVKEDIVVFPHRDDIDKGVPDLLHLILEIKKHTGKAIRYIVTSGGRPTRQSTQALFKDFPEVEFQPNLSKDEYYKLLAKSKVMFSAAIQENFGVCTQESLAFDVVPICPNRVSYQYLLPGQFLYEDIANAAIKVIEYLNADIKCSQFCHHPYSAELIVYHMLLNERK